MGVIPECPCGVVCRNFKFEWEIALRLYLHKNVIAIVVRRNLKPMGVQIRGVEALRDIVVGWTGRIVFWQLVFYGYFQRVPWLDPQSRPDKMAVVGAQHHGIKAVWI